MITETLENSRMFRKDSPNCHAGKQLISKIFIWNWKISNVTPCCLNPRNREGRMIALPRRFFVNNLIKKRWTAGTFINGNPDFRQLCTFPKKYECLNDLRHVTTFSRQCQARIVIQCCVGTVTVSSLFIAKHHEDHTPCQGQFKSISLGWKDLNGGGAVKSPPWVPIIWCPIYATHFATRSNYGRTNELWFCIAGVSMAHAAIQVQ